MRAFIVRPFGTKENVDFDRVHAELIAPALAAVNVSGDTTGEIARAGNIREDMFQLLATADLVVADISIHNANVYYELGVRHALRSSRTFLIRAKLDTVVPFDLKTDRYLEYSATNPGAALPALITGLRQTLDGDRNDSPVLKLLEMERGIISSEVARLLAPPDDFREEVSRAARQGRVGDLALLAEEVGRLAWAREGLRIVGSAQVGLSSWESARATWEQVLRFDPDDVQANTRLATIYKKLNDLPRADQAVERVLKNNAVLGPERAEVGALRASNIKTAWAAEWKDLPDPDERAKAALRSPRLKAAFDAYYDAYADDRNHTYSGLNSLALLTILLELGGRYPDVWESGYESDDDPGAARRQYERKREPLLSAVKLGLDSAERLAKFANKSDRWIAIGRADHAFVKANSPPKVAEAYRRAMTGAEHYYFGIARRQVELFERLGVLRENAVAVLKVFDELYSATAEWISHDEGPTRILVFTGHRIDANGRDRPRFPGTPEADAMARDWIASAVKRECEAAGKGARVIGLAGGGSGSDILFHEVCKEQGLSTEMFLIHSRQVYLKASVQDAGPDWVRRHDALAKKLPVRYLGNSDEPLQHPRWLRPAKDYSIWERDNRWILNNALAYGASKVTLIALWNGESSDGSGGTEDLIQTARERGARVVVIDAKPLAVTAKPLALTAKPLAVNA